MFIIRIVCVFFLIFVLNSAWSQNTNYSEILYLSIGEFSDIDTLKVTVLNPINFNNNENYCFERYSYKLKKPNKECFDFSKIKENKNMKFISQRNFFMNNKSYTVLKFLFDDPNIQDEEEMFFYSNEIGIIIRKNLSWGGYERIIEFLGDIKKTQLAILLGDEIIKDCDFYNKWTE